MSLWRLELEREEVVYRLGGVDPGDGVDAYDLLPTLQRFADLVSEAYREAGNDGALQVHLRPFKEGSFITEFVLSGGLASLFSGEQAAALANVLSILGFAKGVAGNIRDIVKRTHGHVDEFTNNEDGTFTYGSGDDMVTVDEATHRICQSEKVADLYRRVAVGPIASFGGTVQQVNIYVRDNRESDDGASRGASFSRNDRTDFDTYAHLAGSRQDDEVESTSTVQGICLNPVSGSYGGDERGYTFSTGTHGDVSVFKRVSIDDEAFRSRLESGEVRFNSGDVLKVDLEVTQKVSAGGDIKATYRVTRVIDYIPRLISEQPHLPGI